MRTRRVLGLVALLLLTGCATYQPPPLAATHPAHPDARAARVPAASRTLAIDTTSAPAAVAHAVPGSTAAGSTVTGEGEVVATALDTGQIVLDHAAIEGFMDAMTMGYRVDPPVLMDGLVAGDAVRFTVDVARRAIVGIEKVR